MWPVPRITKSVEAFADRPWSGPRDSRFYRNHLVLPLAAALGLSVILIPLHGDFWVADKFYALQGNAWALKSNPIVESMIHLGGRTASAIAWLLVVVAYLKSRIDARFARWHRPLAYLASATLLAVAAVVAVKQMSGMDCPWNLTRYGGDRAFVSLFEHRLEIMPGASCFPAAHASTGYAWVTVYFFFLTTRPRLRWIGLSSALAVGAVLGFVQQLRGAHFISHDIWALMICWLVALIGYISFHPAVPTSRSAIQQAPP